MKHLLLALATCSISYASLAQQVPLPCGTDAERQRLIREEPGYLQYETSLREELREIMRNNATQRGGMTVYTIPIVFHVLHLRGVENISNEQILDAVRILNEDFRKLNADTAGVWPFFQPRIGDAYMEFRLPTKDPVGNCTNGIERIMSVETMRGTAASKLKPWPRDKYLNIWVNRSMGGSGAAGYFSGFPAIADGIMILNGYVGGSGTNWTSDNFTSRALSHEIGHFFSLNHVWGENNGEDGAPAGHMAPECGDDGVDDTPITRGWNTCPSQEASKNCNPDSLENAQNYMEYSYCSTGHMFSKGQCLRMRFAANSPTSQRDGLWSAATLEATGITDGFQLTCAPQADFYAQVGNVPSNPTVPFSPTACTGATVQFHDNSVLAFPTSWSWSFQDGTPSTSSQRNPVVTFSEPGWKTVTLTVANDIGSNTKTNEYAVLIGSSGSAVNPFWEDFENGSGTNMDPFFAQNYEDNITSFKRYEGGGHSGTACAILNSGDRNQLDFIDSPNGTDVDELITPLVNLTGMGGSTFSFWYAYSTTTSVDSLLTEKLEIFSSTDCGRVWTLRSTISGTDLVTNGNNPMMPPALWQLKTLSIPASVAGPTVRFRLRFTSSEYSGNLFIDQVNIGTNVVGIEQLTGTDFMNLFPNPTNDHFTLQVVGMDSQRTEVSITDLRGALVYANVYQPLGGAAIDISTRALGLSEGMYMLHVSNDSGSSVQKLMVGR